MFYDRNSEDIELPNFNSNENLPKQKPEEEVKTNKKVIIAIVIIAGVLVLGVIIFLVIYFSSKKKQDGGYILVTHEVDSNDQITILNIDNLEDNDYTIEKDQVKLDESIPYRRLEEKYNFTIDKNIFKFNENEKRDGRIKFKISFNIILSTMSGMFQKLNNLISIDLSHLNSGKIKSMDSAFLGCTKLEYLNFTNFNSKKVENMDNSFENCRELTEIDLSSFETPKLKSMKSTFKNCANLSFLDLNKFILNNVDTTGIFENDDNLYMNSISVNDENTRNLLNSVLISENENNTNDNDMFNNNCETGGEDKCKECQKDDNIKYQCYSCNEGYYLPSYLNYPIKCKKCYETCSLCIDYMNCYKCKDDYKLNDENKCISNKTVYGSETDIIPSSLSDDTVIESSEILEPFLTDENTGEEDFGTMESISDKI